MECLEIAWRMHALTGGAFDISIGSGLERLELVPDEFVVRAHRRRRSAGPGRHRQGLRGRSHGGAAGGVGDRERSHPRGLQLGARPGRSPGPGRVASHPERAWPRGRRGPGPDLGATPWRSARRARRRETHIRDPLAGRAVDDRTAWTALSCSAGRGGVASREWHEAVRSPAAVAEALSTAFMILPVEEIAELCGRCPGLEAWLIREPPEGGRPGAAPVHLPASSARRGRHEKNAPF